MLVRASLVPALLAATVAAQVDHSASQSPVKDQGGRGTCVAFSISAMLETFPGVPTDLSEQLLYATVKLHQSDVDGWLRRLGREAQMAEGDVFGAYVPLFELVGTCAEPFLPYDPNPKLVGPDVPGAIRRYLELAQIGEQDLLAMRDAFGKYGFARGDCAVLDADAAQDVARIQRALDGGVLAIPVCYLVHGPNWSNAAERVPPAADGRRTFIHPGLVQRFRRPGGEWMGYAQAKLACGASGEDFAESVRTGRLEAGAYDDPKGADYGGHAVTIVGYDDRGFLVKNSWGTRWGDAGYGMVLYDYHRLYATKALLVSDARIRTPVLGPFEQRSRIENGAFRLKIQPRGTGDAARWLLSTWMLEPRDANVEVVEYLVEARDGDGVWSEIARGSVYAGAVEERHGAPLALPSSAFAGARAVRVTARYGDLPLGDPTRLERARFLATRRYPEQRTDLAQAVDLAPAR